MNWLISVVVAMLWAMPLLHPVWPAGNTGHDMQRMLQVPLLALASIAWALRPAVRPAVEGSPGSRSLRSQAVSLALLGLVLMSAAMAAYPLIALRELALFGGLAVLALSLATRLDSKVAATRALRALVVGATVYAVLVLCMLALARLTGAPYAPWEALMGFDNPRFLNHAQTVALPLLGVVAAQRGGGRWRALAWLALVLSGMLLFLTFGRATLVALFVGAVTAGVFFGRRGWRCVLSLMLPLALGFALLWLIYQLLMPTVGTAIDVTEVAKVHRRDYLAQVSLDLITRAPWLGVGPMHFAHWYNGEASHPHNVYLQVLSEYGIPASLLMFALAGRWIWRRLRPLRTADDASLPLAAGLWMATIGVLVDGMFSGNFVMPMSQLWIAVLLALLMAWPRLQGVASGVASPAPASRPAPWRWLVVAAMLALTTVTWRESLGTDRPSLPTDGAVDMIPALKHSTNPRFWSDGWF